MPAEASRAVTRHRAPRVAHGGAGAVGREAQLSPGPSSLLTPHSPEGERTSYWRELGGGHKDGEESGASLL